MVLSNCRTFAEIGKHNERTWLFLGLLINFTVLQKVSVSVRSHQQCARVRVLQQLEGQNECSLLL